MVIEIAECRYPPVLWEWFVEEFSGPTAWFESRIKFSRTLAVMSFVGYVLGLGDRHSENILLDATSGAAVHVDFNCLFEKVFGRNVHNLTNRVKVSRNRSACHSV
jgi:phosphatidylinositol kinase/protein kinase (PI-3  family)